MAACIPTPTLTLFSTVTSTVVVTTFSNSVQTLPDTTSTFTSSSCLSTVSATCVSSTLITGTTVISGGVSTISVPIIITSIVTEVNPTSTLFASCSPSSSVPISTTPSSSQSPSQPSSVTPTTFLVTTTPTPTVVTERASSTLDNGDVTVITITSTSTPPPTVVVLSTSVASASQSQGSRSSVALAPIIGGAVGGFTCLIAVVVIIWFILRKCRGPSDDDGEDDIVFPYPVTRDRDHAQHLDLSHEPKPYEYGLVGHSTHDGAVMAPRSSPSHSRASASDGRPDSATALIGAPSGLTSMAMATGAGGLLPSVPGAQSKGGELGRQISHSAIGHLPPGAAAPATYLGSGSGSGPTPGSSRYPPHEINPQIRSNFPAETVDSSNSSAKAPLVVSEGGGQSARADKKFAPDAPLLEGEIIVHMDGGRLPVSGQGLLASGSGSKTPAQPEPEVSNSDAPPAYVA